MQGSTNSALDSVVSLLLVGILSFRAYAAHVASLNKLKQQKPTKFHEVMSRLYKLVVFVLLPNFCTLHLAYIFPGPHLMTLEAVRMMVMIFSRSLTFSQNYYLYLYVNGRCGYPGMYHSCFLLQIYNIIPC
jgi:hypothetical protein